MNRPLNVSGARLVRRTLVAASALALAVSLPLAAPVVASHAQGVSTATYPHPLPTTKNSPLRVASYNIKCQSCSGGATWQTRRNAVVANIKSQNLDVIGLQEDGQSLLKKHGLSGARLNLTQFEDLRNRMGGSWRMTNNNRYNCKNPKTPYKCKYKYQGASQDTRIMYNSSRLTLLSQGSRHLSGPAGGNPRYVAWATFKQRSTGKRFVYASTHLEPGASNSLTTTEMNETVATVKRNNPHRYTTFIVGDLNSSRFNKPSNGPYNVAVKAGYVDPLGGKARTTKTAPGATVQKRINTWLNSFNDFTRTAKGNKSWKNGSYIDYMFTSKGVKVPEWETVAKLDKAKKHFVGQIPSDHNMIRMTVLLP